MYRLYPQVSVCSRSLTLDDIISVSLHYARLSTHVLYTQQVKQAHVGHYVVIWAAPEMRFERQAATVHGSLKYYYTWAGMYVIVIGLSINVDIPRITRAPSRVWYITR